MRVHINLPATDLNASMAFYKGLFGAPTKTRDDYANWRLDEPGLHLALVHAPGEVVPTDRHYGVEVADKAALDTLHEQVKAAGIPTRVEEQISCCYAVGDKFWAADPDGNAWEFWVRTGESDTLAPRAAEGSTTDCCVPAVPEKTSGGCCG